MAIDQEIAAQVAMHFFVNSECYPRNLSKEVELSQLIGIFNKYCKTFQFKLGEFYYTSGAVEGGSCD